MKKSSNKLENNFVVIQSWMVRDLKLKGNKLIIYAIVYGFLQAEKQVCTCGVEYMRQWIGGAKSTVIRTLNELETEAYIERVEGQSEDGRVMGYRALRAPQKGSNLRPIEPKKGSKMQPKKVAFCNEIGSNLRPPSNNIINNIHTTCVYAGARARESFCQKYGVQGDDDTGMILDFEQLAQAYSESHKFLQVHPIAKCMSWVVKNYDSIIAGKYKDFADIGTYASTHRIVSDYSADEINRIFAELNEDL